MKKTYSLLIFVSLLVLSFSSCKENNPGLGVYTCEVNGTPWSATKETIALHAGSPVNIIGRNDSTTLIINFSELPGTGVYQVMDSTASYVNYIDGPGNYDIYKNGYGSSGTITITEFNSTRIVGTFDSLVLSNGYVQYNKLLTNGVFNVEFQ